MDHAHLCGAVHLRGSQWLPLHVVAVSLSAPPRPLSSNLSAACVLAVLSNFHRKMV